MNDCLRRRVVQFRIVMSVSYDIVLSLTSLTSTTAPHLNFITSPQVPRLNSTTSPHISYITSHQLPHLTSTTSPHLNYLTSTTSSHLNYITSTTSSHLNYITSPTTSTNSPLIYYITSHQLPQLSLAHSLLFVKLLLLNWYCNVLREECLHSAAKLLISYP